MIRLLMLLLVVAAFVIYFIFMLVRGVMKALQGSSRPSSRFTQQDTPPKPKENYKDVQDAKFVELSDEQKESTQESNT